MPGQRDPLSYTVPVITQDQDRRRKITPILPIKYDNGAFGGCMINTTRPGNFPINAPLSAAAGAQVFQWPNSEAYFQARKVNALIESLASKNTSSQYDGQIASLGQLIIELQNGSIKAGPAVNKEITQRLLQCLIEESKTANPTKVDALGNLQHRLVSDQIKLKSFNDELNKTMAGAALSSSVNAFAELQSFYPQWEATLSQQAMHETLHYKAESNPEVKRQLIEIGQANHLRKLAGEPQIIITEATSGDHRWGSDADGKGENFLGLHLTTLANTLYQQEQARTTSQAFDYAQTYRNELGACSQQYAALRQQASSSLRHDALLGNSSLIFDQLKEKLDFHHKAPSTISMVNGRESEKILQLKFATPQAAQAFYSWAKISSGCKIGRTDNTSVFLNENAARTLCDPRTRKLKDIALINWQSLVDQHNELTAVKSRYEPQASRSPRTAPVPTTRRDTAPQPRAVYSPPPGHLTPPVRSPVARRPAREQPHVTAEGYAPRTTTRRGRSYVSATEALDAAHAQRHQVTTYSLPDGIQQQITPVVSYQSRGLRNEIQRQLNKLSDEIANIKVISNSGWFKEKAELKALKYQFLQQVQVALAQPGVGGQEAISQAAATIRSQKPNFEFDKVIEGFFRSETKDLLTRIAGGEKAFKQIWAQATGIFPSAPTIRR